MISETVVELSRWQFAVTAILHFLFIPLTLGLGLILAVIETLFVMTGRATYKVMAQFWARIFAINFVLAIATRLVVTFQFGMVGSYFSLYAGDVFALPLAFEAFSSFFIAAALFGPYWFGWDKLGKYQHLFLAWLIAIAVNLSAYWVLMANGWLQNPIAASFNFQSYRLELTDLNLLLNNPANVAKFLHTLSASYASAAAVLIAICAFWLKNNPDDQMARSSFKLAAGMGILAMPLVMLLGDATPKLPTLVQQIKWATINGEPQTPLLPMLETRVRSGIQAHTLLQALRDGKQDVQLLNDFAAHQDDLGYAYLVKPWNKELLDVKDQQVAKAVQSALPTFPVLIYWSYRIMIAAGVGSLLLLIGASIFSFSQKPISNWLLNLSIYLAPLPWLACLCGWLVAEMGKQPWAIAGVLPTFMSVSSLSESQLLISLVGFALVHVILIGAGLFSMRQAVCSRYVVKGAI